MSSKASHSVQAGESHSVAPRRSDVADPQLADRREGGLREAPPRGVRDLHRSIGNRALASLFGQQEHVFATPDHPAVQSVLRRQGVPLDRSVRAQMERRLGEDFSAVRVHTDATAAKAADSVHAHAFTIGEDVVFDRNRYSPLEESGKRLLAHELAHVVQQRRGGPTPAVHMGEALERSADQTAAAVVHGVAPVRVDGRSARGIARQAKGDDWVYANVDVVKDGADSVVRIEGVPVIRILDDPGSQVFYLKIDAFKSESEKTIKFQFDTNRASQPIMSALEAFKAKGYHITGDAARKTVVQLGEHPLPNFDRLELPNSDTLPPQNSHRTLDLTPTPKPQPKPRPKPVAKPKPPVKKAAPPPTPKKEEQKNADLPPLPPPAQDLPPLLPPQQTDSAGQTQLTPPSQNLTPAPVPLLPSPQDLAPPSQIPSLLSGGSWKGDDGNAQPLYLGNANPYASREYDVPPETIEHALQTQIWTEIQDVDPVVSKLKTDAEDNPKDVVLNVARGTLQRLKDDIRFVEEVEKRNGVISADGQYQIDRFKQLEKTMEDVVAKAEKWHADNDAGKSLGMYNEQWGTWLAGAYDSETDKGGVHYVTGGLAIAGAFLVAFVDAGEKTFSFGYHDTATAVAEAYARGDISWNEGEDILDKAASRAILTALITRGAGAATSSLGRVAAGGLGLAERTTLYGVVSGGVSGGLGAATGLATQSLLTKGAEGSFTNPEAKAIWDQGLPQGKDWAIAVPLGVFLGSLGGVNEVNVSNQKLVGTVVNTPNGQLKVSSVTSDGRVILEPVSRITGSAPPATIQPAPDPVISPAATVEQPPTVRPTTNTVPQAQTVTDTTVETNGAAARASGNTPTPAAQSQRLSVASDQGATVSTSGDVQAPRTVPDQTAAAGKPVEVTQAATDSPVKTLEANPDQAIATAKPAPAAQTAGDTPVQATTEANQAQAKTANPDEAARTQAAPPRNETDPTQTSAGTPEAAKIKQRISALEEERVKVQKDLDSVRARESALNATVERETKLANDLEKQIKAASNAQERANLRSAQTEAYRRRLAAQREIEKVPAGTDELAQLRRIERETNQLTRELFKGSKPWRSTDLATADTAQVGIYGELETSTRMQANGLRPAGKTLNPEDIVTPKELEAATQAWHGQQGIDGIYKRVNPETGKTEYWAGESKATGIGDAKTPTGKGRIDSTLDGDQLSNEWIRARLPKSGLSAAEQAEFERALNAGEVRKFYSQTTQDGTRFYNVIDRSNTEIELGNEITQF